MELFGDVYFYIGMRFHSVVFQTIISGRNYILDYTEPNKVIISSFIKDIDEEKYFCNRYILLQKDKVSTEIFKNEEQQFICDSQSVKKRMNIYIERLHEVFD